VSSVQWLTWLACVAGRGGTASATDHQPIQLCPVLPPPSSCSCIWCLLSTYGTFLQLQVFFGLPLWPCDDHCWQRYHRCPTTSAENCFFLEFSQWKTLDSGSSKMNNIITYWLQHCRVSEFLWCTKRRNFLQCSQVFPCYRVWPWVDSKLSIIFEILELRCHWWW